MKNLGIIINGANFTDSPLGIVTILADSETTATNIVNTFATKIGSTAYNTPIKTMVKSMIDEGLWDDCVYLFPCVGTTLNSLKQNLKGSQEMILRANASADTNKINFANTISIGDVSGETGIGDAISSQKYCHITRLTAPLNGVNGSNIGSIVDTTSGAFTTILSGGLRQVAEYLINSLESRMYSGVSCEDTHTYSFVSNVTNVKMYVDGVQKTEGTYKEYNLKLRYGYGYSKEFSDTSAEGTTIPANIKLFNGDISFTCVGKWSEEQSEKMNEIVATFVNALGK